MDKKIKYVEVTLKKNTKLCRNLKKVTPLKMLLLNVTYQKQKQLLEVFCGKRCS